MVISHRPPGVQGGRCVYAAISHRPRRGGVFKLLFHTAPQGGGVKRLVFHTVPQGAV